MADTQPEKAATASDVRAAQLLRARSLWAAPLIVTSVLIICISVLCLGPIIDPAAHLNGLPVVVVDRDTGAATASGRVDLGEQVVTALTRTPAVTDRLAVTVTGLPGAEAQMNRAAAYATVVIPPGFTASVLALAGASRAAAAVVAIGTLVFFAALGTLGQVLALLVFIYLGLASSGGIIPLQALPGFYRFVASFEPFRQIVGAIRAILYFNAAGDAGLDRGLILTAVGLVLWVAVGTAVTRWYDRTGLDRLRSAAEPRSLIDSSRGRRR